MSFPGPASLNAPLIPSVEGGEWLRVVNLAEVHGLSVNLVVLWCSQILQG